MWRVWHKSPALIPSADSASVFSNIFFKFARQILKEKNETYISRMKTLRQHLHSVLRADLEDAHCSLYIRPCFVHSFLIMFLRLPTVLFLCFVTEQYREEARQSPVSGSVIFVLHPYFLKKYFGQCKIGSLSSKLFDLKKVLAFCNVWIPFIS